MSERIRATITKPIITGSVATYSPTAPQQKSYKWFCYVKGLQNEDISHWISKVVFRLHSTFPNPVREVTRSPFMVSESGWGEFEMVITIHFANESEKPVELVHFVQLFPKDGNKTPTNPIVNECYDEIIFTDPKEDFYEQLIKKPKFL